MKSQKGVKIGVGGGGGYTVAYDSQLLNNKVSGCILSTAGDFEEYVPPKGVGRKKKFKKQI